MTFAVDPESPRCAAAVSTTLVTATTARVRTTARMAPTLGADDPPVVQTFQHPERTDEVHLYIGGAKSEHAAAWAYEIHEKDGTVSDERSGQTWGGVGGPRALVPRAHLCAILLAMRALRTPRRIILHSNLPDAIGRGFAAANVGREVNFKSVVNGDVWRELCRLIVVDGFIVEHCSVEDDIVRRVQREAVQALGIGMGMPKPPKDETPVPWTGVSERCPDRFEVLLALAQLRNGAPGEDGIKARDLQQPEVSEAVVHLVQETWRTRKIPKAFARALIVALAKKAGASSWDDHRGITLLATSGKVLARVIFNRCRGAPVSAMQHGFRQYNSTTEAAFYLTSAVGEARRCGLPLVAVFVDLTKAYDTVPREQLWRVAERQGLRGTALELVKQLYVDSISVRVGQKKCKDQFRSSQGVRQGCLLSPMLFNWYFDTVLREAEKRIAGVPFGSKDGGATWRPRCAPTLTTWSSYPRT